MSARALSRETGLAYSHIQYLESDAKSPGDETLRKLARALDIPVDELRGDQVANQTILLLEEVKGGITEEHAQAIVDAVERAAARGRK